MLRLDRELAQFLRSHHGVADRRALDRLRVPIATLRRLARAGVLERVSGGAWRLTTAPPTVEHRIATACATHPTISAAFTTAGRLWGLRGMGSGDAVDVMVRGDAHPSPPDCRLHQCYHVDDIDIVQRNDGIRVTSPARTAFDLAAVLTDRQLESVIEQLLDQGLCTYEDLVDAGRRLRQRGRTGSARFGRVLASRPAHREPVESDLELRLERAVVSAGLPRPVRQRGIRLPNGQRIRADFYWPDQKLVFEVDHFTWHGGRAAATADKRRDRLLARIGVRSLRATNDEIRYDIDAVVRDIAGVLAPRS